MYYLNYLIYRSNLYVLSELSELSEVASMYYLACLASTGCEEKQYVEYRPFCRGTYQGCTTEE